MKRLAILTIATIILSILTLTAVYCADVTPWRILREHRITVATNGRTDRLDRAFLDWQFAPAKTMTLFQLLLERDNLKSDGDVLFIIDRSQPISREEAALLPIPLSAIDNNEVLTAVVKKSIGNKRNYRNGWLILVTAPNQTWLEKELELIPRVLNIRVEERPNVPTRLHFYDVVMLEIVSNIDERLPQQWVEAQMDPNRQAVDYVFSSLDSWRGACRDARNLMFILDRQKIGQHKDRICSAVPNSIRDWINGDASRSEGIAVQGEVEIDSKRIRSYAIVAPCERLINRMLVRFPSIDMIPSTPARFPFGDLSDFGQMAVVARFADKTDTQAGILHDFCNKMLSALGASSTGFECKSYQDLRELEIDKLLAGDSVSKDDVNRISQKLNNARGLMVLSVASVDMRTTYGAGNPVAVTQPYPPFSKPKPLPPVEPSLDDRKYGFFGPKLYTGPDDPNYLRRKAQYQDARRQWEYNMAQWQREHDEYESARRYHDVEWKVQVDQIETVEVTGNIAIYDTRRGSDIAGTLVYSAPVKGQAEKRDTYREMRLVVTGEDRLPEVRDIPDARDNVDDQTLLSTALENAAKNAVKQIIDSCILPTDRIAGQ